MFCHIHNVRLLYFNQCDSTELLDYLTSVMAYVKSTNRLTVVLCSQTKSDIV